MKASKRVPHGTRCVYCGEKASSWDHHLRPYSYDNDTDWQRRVAYQESEVVPACKPCNSILNDRFLPEVVPRARYIRSRLIAKHESLLSTPAWTQEEYRELGPRLYSFIRSKQLEKAKLYRRLAHLNAVIGDSYAQISELHWLLSQMEIQGTQNGKRIVKRIRALLSDLVPGFDEFDVLAVQPEPEALGNVPTIITEGEVSR